MDHYYPDIFYDTNELSKNQIRKLFIEAKELSSNWRIDDLPDWTRRKTEWPFEKAIRLFERTTRKRLHISFIHRRGYEDWPQHLEIGFCTLGRKNKNGDIFLWIDLDLEHKDYLLNKYFEENKTL